MGYRLRLAAAAHARRRGDQPFRVLVGNVSNESFSDSQLAVVAQATTRNFFRITQVKALIDLVAFSATKLRVLELCAPRIVDGENAFALFRFIHVQRRQGTGERDPAPQRHLSRVAARVRTSDRLRARGIVSPNIVTAISVDRRRDGRRPVTWTRK